VSVLALMLEVAAATTITVQEAVAWVPAALVTVRV
jgi:hypothetical protein